MHTLPRSLPALLLAALCLAPAAARADALATVTMTAGGSIDASTYTTGSILVRNDSTAGETLTRLRLDLSTAFLPDVVFDPNGQAGDPTGKAFTVDSDPGVGIVGHAFLFPHDGGFDALEITFSDFDPGETLTFSVDIDPTSIQGAATPGPNDSGSVSGLELTGATLEAEFDDLSLHVGEPFALPASVGGSEVVLRAGPPPAPALAVVGEPVLPVVVTNGAQTVRVTGTPGAQVALLQVEAGLFLAGVPGGGFDLDPFEANSAVAVTEHAVVLDGAGIADVPLTLTQAGPESGYHHFVAVELDGAGLPGRTSPPAIVRFQPPGAPTAIRINVNGPAHVGVDFPGSWQADPGVGGVCGPFENATNAAINGTVDDPLFKGEVFGNPVSCAVGAGTLPPDTYDVTLLFAEIHFGDGCPGPGAGAEGPPRLFGVALEGTTLETNIDLLAEAGCAASTTDPTTGVVTRTYTVDVFDGTLDISLPGSVNNGKISAIQLVSLGTGGGGSALQANPASIDFGQAQVGGSSGLVTVVLSNNGSTGDPDIQVSSVSVPAPFSTNFVGPVTVPPGSATSFDAVFAPTNAGPAGATLIVSHDGVNGDLQIPLSGVGVDPGGSTVSFAKRRLAGAAPDRPTSLQMGPDGRLYVAQQDGWILAYTLQRDVGGNYSVVATEAIDLVRQIPNHDDDGTPNLAVTDRQVTGLLVTGTAANPVLYVGSSDPRIGAGSSGTDLGLDTNSGVISRLDWNGSQWTRFDVVRGLPRSEENHAINGLALDPATNTLYATIGGFTNMGAPSNNFALTPEYALSAAILSIDLDAIGSTTYDLPTLDDEDRPGDPDANDPFGGNDGKNQARLVPGGPVQVHAPGFRNPYDVVLTQAGRMYSIDNGPNAGWGNVPKNEGTTACTNAVREPGDTHPDGLHYVTGPGYYAGHPNPTRANQANTFNASNPQSPVPFSHPVECDYRTPGVDDGALATWPFSTNGLAEYTGSAFAGALQGNLLTVGFDDSVQRIVLNATGDAAVLVEPLFSSAGPVPLDVWAQSDSDVFAGTIWVAVYFGNAIDVYEPQVLACSGADDPLLDEDGDGYRNDDEIDNLTDPCSPADVPPDRDGDLVSDLNDPDDDNDGQPDTSDPFAIDPANGTATSLPVVYSWDNNQPSPGGLLGLGFTGLMTDGASDYLSLFDPTLMTAGGAAGVTTVDQVTTGTAADASNDQEYGFQFGVAVGPGSPRFTAHTRILVPFSGLTPGGGESMGIQLGTGGQDDYAALVVTADGGPGGVAFRSEVGGVGVNRPVAPVALPGPDAVDLYLDVDPAAATVTPSYALTVGGVPQPRQALGGPEAVPPGWLDGSAALAVGLISTSVGGAPFAATWDFIEVVPFPACDDGIDNDGDGDVDAAEDFGCDDAADVSERSPALVCDDGADNDGDGLVDFPADPGCAGSFGNDEAPACNDGVDNDGDGLVDLADPTCGSASAPRESPARSCGLGLESALGLPLWWALRRRGWRRGRALR